MKNNKKSTYCNIKINESNNKMVRWNKKVQVWLGHK